MKNISTIDRLKDLGYRLTPQRKRIIDIFESSTEAQTVKDIIGTLKNKKVDVDDSTVYRFIELLNQEKLVAHSSCSGEHAYQLTEKQSEPTLVLICNNCNDKMKYSVSNKIANKHIKKARFKKNSLSITSYGICSKCQ